MAEPEVKEPEVPAVPEAPEVKQESIEESEFKPGVGVDVGTCNIVVARQKKDGTFVNKFHRNMLYPLNVSDESEELLERGDYLYVKVDNKYYVVGEDALRLVRAIGSGEVVRPMKDGILNPSLKSSSELLFYIIKAVVGKPMSEKEPLRFSLPADPIDVEKMNNLFHNMLLNKFFTQMGYNPKPVNEAMCICYDSNPIMKSEDEGDVPLSGIVCSCGGGMWNIALSYKGIGLLEFSCTKSGDYLDELVSQMTGVSVSKVIKTKEKNLDLEIVPVTDNVLQALSIYYDEMIDRMVHYINTEFQDKNSEMDGKIEVVVAGGTSMANGFCRRLAEAIEGSEFPFEIYGVRHAKDPFHAVSQGACIRAQADYEKSKSKKS